jgi:hypothetical protein
MALPPGLERRWFNWRFWILLFLFFLVLLLLLGIVGKLHDSVNRM